MGWYLYRFKNTDGDTIYVGKTSDLSQRLCYHFGSRGHLPVECYNQTKKIEVLKLKSNDTKSLARVN